MLHSEAGITDSFEDPIMSSYPMKVALIHQVEEGREQGTFKYTPNEKNTEYSRTCSYILDHVDKEGGGLKSYYIENDAIFKPGQRSYLEARRIALYINSIRRDYATHGIINTLLISVIFWANFLILLAFIGGKTAIGELPNDNYDHAHVAMIMRPMSIISFILCIIGFLLAFGFLACSCYDSDFGGSKPGPTVVYGLHKWVMGYYSAFGLIQLIPLVCYSYFTYCNTYLFDPYHPEDWKENCSASWKNYISVLLSVSIGIASLTCIVILIHFIFIMIRTKGRPNNHFLGLVFYGCCICREYPCCTQCRSCTKPQTNDSQHSDSIASETVIVGGRVSDNQESELLIP